jgi:hypothetical protein
MYLVMERHVRESVILTGKAGKRRTFRNPVSVPALDAPPDLQGRRGSFEAGGYNARPGIAMPACNMIVIALKNWLNERFARDGA